MKIVFLDIDGVLQPCNSDVRFTSFYVQKILLETALDAKDITSIDFDIANKEAVVEAEANNKHDTLFFLRNCLAQINPEYGQLDRYDIAAVCCDWEKSAVKLLKLLCFENDAKIVVSSDWRYHRTFEQLKLLFKIHGLDELVIDHASLENRRDHPSHIKQYLEEHLNIIKFVILDDGFRNEFEKTFPNEFVYNDRYFTTSLYRKANAILK